jgi:hypothetical protein
MGSFSYARGYALAGLAIFAYYESHQAVLNQAVLDLKPQLEMLRNEAFERRCSEAAEESKTPSTEVTWAAPASIKAGFPWERGGLETTSYFLEAQFRELRPGSQQRFLATTGVLNCIAVLASSPDGRAFGAHINNAALLASLHATKVLWGPACTRPASGQGGMILENMSRAMQRAFRDVEPSQVTISLVGGHKKMDLLKELKGTYYPEEEEMWRFSGVVRRCVAEALPGARIDTSLLNRFNGVERESFTMDNKFRCFRQGQAYRVVVLDSHTGNVEMQSTDHSDFTTSKAERRHGYPDFLLPESVYEEECDSRMEVRQELSPMMTEYKD